MMLLRKIVLACQAAVTSVAALLPVMPYCACPSRAAAQHATARSCCCATDAPGAIEESVCPCCNRAGGERQPVPTDASNCACHDQTPAQPAVPVAPPSKSVELAPGISPVALAASVLPAPAPVAAVADSSASLTSTDRTVLFQHFVI